MLATYLWCNLAECLLDERESLLMCCLLLAARYCVYLLVTYPYVCESQDNDLVSVQSSQ